jgi:hypothetical protein
MMAMAAQLNENFLKSKSTSYELDSIFTLSLSHSNLLQLKPIINLCTNLINLDLSYNHLSNIQLFDGKKLTKLTSLTLSFNEIQEFPSNLYLPTVTQLYLLSNKISNIAHLAQLPNSFPSLNTLYLQTYDNQHSNPVCSDNNYKSNILTLYPKLLCLDGHYLNEAAEVIYNKEYHNIQQLLANVEASIAENEMNQQKNKEKLHQQLSLLLQQNSWAENEIIVANLITANQGAENNIAQIIKPRVESVEQTLKELHNIEEEINEFHAVIQQKLTEKSGQS